MKSSYFIGLDFGTQGVRCGVFDTDGEAIAISEKKHTTYYPEPGWAEQIPADWIAGMEEAIQECFSIAGSHIFDCIKGISVCSTSSTVILVDRKDIVLRNAILWMDLRAKDQAARINQSHHQILKYCGGEVSAEWFVPKILWLKESEPDLYKRAKLIVEQQDYANHYLTGIWCSSISQATCKANYVEELKGYDFSFFNDIGLDDYRNKTNRVIKKQGEEIGTIKLFLAEKYHLPADVKIYQGGIDAHVNMIGLGVSKPGDMGIVMGSSFVHFAITEKSVYKEGVWGPYQNAIIPDLYCLEGGQISAGSITKWFLNEFQVNCDDPYKVMADEANKVDIGSEGLVVLDFFQGNRTPFKDPFAKGVIYGLTLSHKRSHVYRAILESIAFGTRNIINTLDINGKSSDGIRCCGGVTKNSIWLQIIADVTGKQMLLTKNSSDAGVLGGAIIAAVGSGKFQNFEDACGSMVHQKSIVKPDMINHEKYSRVYDVYLDIYKSLKHLGVN